MIEYVENGNIFNSKAQTLVNPVNCVGVMGKGLALEFKEKYPDNFCLYKTACGLRIVDMGKINIFYQDCLEGEKPLPIVINFPTKKHWKDKSKLSYIERGLQDLHRVVVKHDIKSIAIPMLGCGLGSLNKKDVISLLENFAELVPTVNVEVYL